MTTFTAAETKLLTACMRCMVSDVSQCIDFNKVALEAGYKDAKNAKVMFGRLKKAKLDGAMTGAGVPKPTTPTKKGTRGTTTAARKGGNGGIVKATGGAGAKGGKARKGGKAVTDGAAVYGDAEMRDDDEEGVAGVKAENSGGSSGDGEWSKVEFDGSGEEVVKEEHHDEGADGQVVNGFTAINHAGVEEADELGAEEEA